MRGLAAPLIFPKPEPLTLLVGLFRLVWLKALKNSARNWKLHCSRTGKFLNNPMFQVKSPGPRKLSLRTVPKVPVAGNANASGFSQLSQCADDVAHAPC